MAATTSSVRSDGAAILRAARDLAPGILAQAERVEQERQLPAQLYRDLVGAGIIRMAMPRAWGGPELDPITQIEVIEALSHADASVGWCACILSDSGFYAAFLEEDAAREVFPDIDGSCAGMLAPVGRAVEVEGGYRVSGHWAFGSGIRHADRVSAGCLVVRDGQPVIDEGGMPRWRVMLTSAEHVQIEDTWHTTGLAGSGSHDYEMTDVFVPAAHSFDVLAGSRREEPLYRYHGLFFANVPGVPLGLARRALDEAARVASEKRSVPSMKLLAEDARVQTTLAEAEAILGSARSYCFDVFGELWETLQRGDTPSMHLRARVALVIAHTGRSAARAVELACEVAGTTALYRRHPLERIRRDMIAVGSHLVHQPKVLASIGASLLGQETGPTFF